MLNKEYIPHDQTTINAIKMWVKQTNDELDLLEKGLILDADQDQSIIEEVCQSIEKKGKRKNVNEIRTFISLYFSLRYKLYK